MKRRHCAECGLLQRIREMYRRGCTSPPVYVCIDLGACAKRAEAAR